MSNVLALIELTPAGALASGAASTLAAAAKVGTPIAVVVAKPGVAQAAAAELGALGAESHSWPDDARDHRSS